MKNIQKNFREIDSFHLTSFLAWTFLNVLAHCEFKALEITFRVNVGLSASQKLGSKSGNQGHNKGQE